ncbi:MAG: tetratricopeptide repeat protein, partial [Cyanobacteria bacterium J06632_22]
MKKSLGLPLAVLLSMLLGESVAVAKISDFSRPQPLTEWDEQRWDEPTGIMSAGMQTGWWLPEAGPIGAGSKQTSDPRQAEAERLFNEALNLWRVSRWPEAIEKLEQALVLYREAGDLQGEGRTLTGLGAVSSSLGQYPQALSYYEQSLVILREVGDRAGEGVTLNN